MKCPHCSVMFHDQWFERQLNYNAMGMPFDYRAQRCPNCGNWIVEIDRRDNRWRLIEPIGANRGPVPPEVPASIAGDYIEACGVLPISPKASAALSRRCLQNMVRANGYKGRDLAVEVDMLINEADPRRAIPESLRVVVDAVRNFGNFSAHPVTDVTSLQIIEVEPEEAEWCLEFWRSASSTSMFGLRKQRRGRRVSTRSWPLRTSLPQKADRSEVVEKCTEQRAC